ncbi:HupE/UreJ family protein [Falsiroseomonas selenitidurans]|uniref:Urease accessory protein UreJ n=1 Tax=Falsiroseomonas selenitidurans TaxID=2716335 RepID=A0ABX1EBU2_9PROT|nr:HupE/UreJ family protein [Falsiroseomonas selenitidurans]NKC34296.1 urease accessory protein UreJ [Falsiroseomonas selenitidurans]
MTSLFRRLALPALLLAPIPALAHHPMGGAVPSTFWHGIASGVAHPVIGADHLAFLLAVGLLAGLAGWGLARPLAFVAASLAGVAAGWLGFWLPGVEVLVAATVVLAGLLLALRAALPAAAWSVLLALAGLAHGQAYAEAMIGAEATPVLAYLLGLALVQGGLVAALAWAVHRAPALVGGMAPRLAGMAVAAVGVVALVGLAG